MWEKNLILGENIYRGDPRAGKRYNRREAGTMGAGGNRTTGSTDRRWPMELRLTKPEVELLHGLLEADLKELLMEIARTDTRSMREGLLRREELLKGILDRLMSVVGEVS